MGFIGNKPADTFHTTVKQSFTADSSTISFTLNQSVAGENEIELFINNVRQEPGTGKAYTAAGTTLTMSEAPTTGDDMYCIFQGKAQGHHFVPNASIQGSHIHTTFDLTGDASTTAFTIASGRTVNDLLVFVNGICLVPTDDYTVSGTTLTFVTAPAASAEITIRVLPK